MKINWNYPTSVWVGENRIKDLVEACKNLNISNPLFVTDKDLINLNMTKKIISDIKKNFNNLVKPNGINIDPDVDPYWAKDKLKNVVIQGGLDPNVLLKTEEEIILAATKYIQAFKGFPYVFNLGHGLLPETDPDKVAKLVKFYRNFNE